ncbi:hypothetical protein LPJ66_001051 [Kickxella alabastrina]|uniref:Uncharacterized protein n=1 Tax=Kickxella alabastrina TaxID=61397 RepID=A0ACC1IUM1_9FUNG|nr:hypothetical protein LPJ66_001051 [Kickxella alabastrina]
MVCTICHDPLLCADTTSGTESAVRTPSENRPVALGCGHTYHKVCIETWINGSSMAYCPVCHKLHIGQVLSLFIDPEDVQVSAKPQQQVAVASSSRSNRDSSIVGGTKMIHTRYQFLRNNTSSYDGLDAVFDEMSLSEHQPTADSYDGDYSYIIAVQLDQIDVLNSEKAELEREMEALREELYDELYEKDRHMSRMADNHRMDIDAMDALLNIERAKNESLEEEIARLKASASKHKAHIGALQRTLNRERNSYDRDCQYCYINAYSCLGTVVDSMTSNDLSPHMLTLSQCGHRFHEGCITKYRCQVYDGGNCPSCEGKGYKEPPTVDVPAHMATQLGAKRPAKQPAANKTGRSPAKASQSKTNNKNGGSSKKKQPPVSYIVPRLFVTNEPSSSKRIPEQQQQQQQQLTVQLGGLTIDVDESEDDEYFVSGSTWHNKHGNPLMSKTSETSTPKVLQDVVTKLKLQIKESQIRELAVAKNHRIVLRGIVDEYQEKLDAAEKHLEEKTRLLAETGVKLAERDQELDDAYVSLDESRAETSRLSVLSDRHKDHINSLQRLVDVKKRIIDDLQDRLY